MRRAQQEGHTPRHLQEYAISKSCWHIVAVSASEAASEDAAFEIAAKCPLAKGRRCFTVLVACEFQPGFEVGLNYMCDVAEKHQVLYLWLPHLKDPKDDMVLELALLSQPNMTG